jgi:hypothetical protein
MQLGSKQIVDSGRLIEAFPGLVGRTVPTLRPVSIWPAAGFVDTENRWFMKPEVGNGKTVIQSRV